MVVACLLLGISGGIRFWRGWQFAILSAKSVASPFPLNELSKTYRDWRALETEVSLPPEVARLAGSSDHVVRTYLDKKTNEQVSSLMLYGLSEKVFCHSPEICYPAAGFQLYQGPVDREIQVPGLKAPVRYRWAIYMKRVSGVAHYEETYHTFCINNEWVPDAGVLWKMFRHYPGMHRILLSCQTTNLRPEWALKNEGSRPSEELLAAIAREISSRLRGNRIGGTNPADPVPASPDPSASKPKKEDSNQIDADRPRPK
jgi:hypothetical protein